MSVQIIENWSDLNGTVRSLNFSSGVTGFVAVEIAVDQVKPVEGFANLLNHVVGKDLVVLVPSGLVKSLAIAPGDVIVCRVRRTNSNRTFVHRNYISTRPST